MSSFGYHAHVAGLLFFMALTADANAQDGHRMSPGGPGHSGSTATPAMPMSAQERAEKRFPQPVRVGDLTGRLVLEPSNHQTVIGRVAGVARTGDAIRLVVRYGGLLGFGTRTIAVPIEATALLGQFVQVVDLNADQLRALPDWAASAGVPIDAEDRIRIGLNRN